MAKGSLSSRVFFKQEPLCIVTVRALLKSWFGQLLKVANTFLNEKYFAEFGILTVLM